MSDFGTAVREARTKGSTDGKELSQVELGRLVGVTGVTISRIESGERDPSFGLALRIAQALDIDLNLLKRDGGRTADIAPTKDPRPSLVVVDDPVPPLVDEASPQW